MPLPLGWRLVGSQLLLWTKRSLIEVRLFPVWKHRSAVKERLKSEGNHGAAATQRGTEMRAFPVFAGLSGNLPERQLLPGLGAPPLTQRLYVSAFLL